jgi:hypothetical protein
MQVAYRVKTLVKVSLLWATLILSNILTADNNSEFINISFTVVASDKSTPEEIAYFTDGKKVEILQFKHKERSAVYNYKGTKKLSFFDKNQLLDSDPSNIPTPIASVNIENCTKPLLLFFSRSGSKDTPWQVIPVEEDFSTGKVKIFNACDTTLFGLLNNKNIQLTPYAVETFNSDQIDGSINSVDAKFAVKYKNKYELTYSSTIGFEPNARTILILRPPMRKNSLLIDTWLLEDFPKSEPDLSEFTQNKK